MITHFNRENLAANLPDAYRKDKNSNNFKLLELERNATERLREAVAEISDSLDLNLATGSTLDEYGAMIGQDRGAATDEQYRVLIKARIARNLANGDYNSVVSALAISLDCKPEEISLIELDEPCKVQLGTLPFAILNQLGVDVNTIVKIIKGLIPAGVWLEGATFSGTFEFGGTELTYDENAGFGNVDQTIGGYLGLTFDGNTADLPV